MDHAEAVFLGALQGLTEFLPISSSGHLVVAHRLFQSAPQSYVGELFFDVMVHFGTALAIVVRYRRPLAEYFDQFVFGTRAVLGGAVTARQACRLAGFRLAGLILLALLPIPLGAVVLEPLVESSRLDVLPVAICFLITGTVLFLAERLRHGTRELLRTGWQVALIVGVAQTLAILPGISRSGMTIAAGLALGLRAGWAVEFSMLMGVPAIGGAVLYSVWKLMHAPAMQLPLGSMTCWADGGGFLAVAAGAITAAVVGYLALSLLIKLATRRRLSWFSYYLWPLGAVLIVLSVTGRI